MGVAIPAPKSSRRREISRTLEGSRAAPGPAASAATPLVLASDQSYPSGIAVDSTHVYWTNNELSGEVLKVPK